MENSVIKFFNNKQDKLFGFIESADGDVFFHLNNGPAPVNGKKRLPQKGDRVSFEREMGQKGPKAKSWTFDETANDVRESGSYRFLEGKHPPHPQPVGLYPIIIGGNEQARDLVADYKLVVHSKTTSTCLVEPSPEQEVIIELFELPLGNPNLDHLRACCEQSGYDYATIEDACKFMEIYPDEQCKGPTLIFALREPWIDADGRQRPAVTLHGEKYSNSDEYRYHYGHMGYGSANRAEERATFWGALRGTYFARRKLK